MKYTNKIYAHYRIVAEKKTILDAKKVIMEKEHYSKIDSIKIIDSFHPMRELDNDDEIQYGIYIVSLDPHGDANVYMDAQNENDASEAAEEWWLKNHPNETEIETVRVVKLKV